MKLSKKGLKRLAFEAVTFKYGGEVTHHAINADALDALRKFKFEPDDFEPDDFQDCVVLPIVMATRLTFLASKYLDFHFDIQDLYLVQEMFKRIEQTEKGDE